VSPSLPTEGVEIRGTDNMTHLAAEKTRTPARGQLALSGDASRRWVIRARDGAGLRRGKL